MPAQYDGSIRIDTKVNAQGVNTGVNSMQKSFLNLGKVIAGVFSAAVLVGFVKSSVSAYRTMIENETKLTTVMRARQGATDDQIRATMRFIDAEAKRGVVSREVQLAAAQEVAGALDSYESIQTLIPAINNMVTQMYGYAASTDQARSAAMMMGKVMDGQLTGMSRAGYVWSAAEEAVLKYGTEAERAAKIAEIVARSSGQMNYALLKTPVGRMRLLENSLTMIRAEFGAAFVELSTLFLPALYKLVNVLSFIANIARQVAQAVALIFGRQAEVLDDSAESSDNAAQGQLDLADATEEAGKAAKGALAGFDELNVLQQDIGDEADNIADSMDFGNVGGGSIGLGEAVELDPEIEGFFKNLGDWLERIWEIAEPTREAIAAFVESLEPLKDFAFGAFSDFYEYFLKPIGEWALGSGLPQLFDAFTDFVKSVDLDRIRESFAGLWKALEPLGKAIGQGIIDFYREFLLPMASWVMNEALPRFVDALAEGLASVDWSRINDALVSLWRALLPFAKGIGEGLITLWEKFLVPLAAWTVGEAFPRFVEILSEGLGKINWDKINEGFSRLWEALLPFAITVGEGLLWLWENVFVPFGTWVMNEVVPRFLDLMAAALDALGAIIEALKPGFQWLWDNMLKPIADWAADKFIVGMDWLTDALERFSQWAAENEGVVLAIAGAITAFFLAWQIASILTPIGTMIAGVAVAIAVVKWLWENWDLVKEKAGEAWDWIVQKWNDAGRWFDETVIQPIKDFFSGLWNGITTWASETWQGIVDAFVGAGRWFDETVIQPIVKFFEDMWTGITKWASDAWQGIVDAWRGAVTWFNNTIVTPIKDFFGGLWTGIMTAGGAARDWIMNNVIDPIRNGFQGLLDNLKLIWEGITDALKGVLNGAIGGIESAINGIIGGINRFIETINSMIRTAFSFLGKKGDQIPQIGTISPVSFPRLATGAVIPPNAEFLAVMGDQKSGRNIEAPEGLIRRIVAEELAAADMGSSSVTLEASGDLAGIIRLLRLELSREDQRKGKNLIIRAV